MLLGPKSLREDWGEKVQDVGLDSQHCSLAEKRSPFHVFLSSTPKGTPHAAFILCSIWWAEWAERHLLAPLHPKQNPGAALTPRCLWLCLGWKSTKDTGGLHQGQGQKPPLLPGQLLVSTGTEQLAAQFISHFYSLDTIIDPQWIRWIVLPAAESPLSMQVLCEVLFSSNLGHILHFSSECTWNSDNKQTN